MNDDDVVNNNGWMDIGEITVNKINDGIGRVPYHRVVVVFTIVDIMVVHLWYVEVVHY